MIIKDFFSISYMWRFFFWSFMWSKEWSMEISHQIFLTFNVKLYTNKMKKQIRNILEKKKSNNLVVCVRTPLN